MLKVPFGAVGAWHGKYGNDHGCRSYRHNEFIMLYFFYSTLPAHIELINKRPKRLEKIETQKLSKLGITVLFGLLCGSQRVCSRCESGVAQGVACAADVINNNPDGGESRKNSNIFESKVKRKF